jgi:hypothetical protein
LFPFAYGSFGTGPCRTHLAHAAPFHYRLRLNFNQMFSWRI